VAPIILCAPTPLQRPKNYQNYLENRELGQQKEIATKFSYIDKWVNNEETELDDSKTFGTIQPI
jgi:hypothetical protein